jgi:tRNA (Thr-GGU) A37 N-methylase
VFATRSPVRPNPIGLRVVALLERRGNVLRVRGLDAIDGTPVLDLKPYLFYYDGVDGSTVADWAHKRAENSWES